MAPIIFVWIGQFLRDDLVEFLLFARERNPNRDILIILNERLKPSLRRRLRGKNIKIHVLEDEENNIDQKLDPKKIKFSGDFWVNTSLRFFLP